MTGRLAGKVALVFGAGAVDVGGDAPALGNGQAAALAYARAGARVLAVDRDGAAVARTVALIREAGGAVEAHVGDILEASHIGAALAACESAFGPPSILHNNVGISEMGGLEDTTPESWDRVMAVNLRAMFLCCRTVVPAMRRAGGGAIVNIASMAGVRVPGYRYIGYAVSKAGVIHLTRTIAMEYAAQGIRANAILPGKLDTPHIYAHIQAQHGGDRAAMAAARAASVPMQRMGTARDVAHAAVFLASDEAAFITGVALPVDGGAHCAG